VGLIAWGRMMKRKQVRGLTEAVDWDEKTHIGENPADEAGNKSKVEKFSKPAQSSVLAAEDGGLSN